MTKPVVGIDVGKAKLDVARADEPRVWTWNNDAKGRAELSDWIVAQKASLVVVEASGGYETALVSELVSRGVAVALVNPSRVRAFAKAEGILAKTDKIDARVIARFGATMKPQARARREQPQVELNELVTRRRFRSKNIQAPPRKAWKVFSRSSMPKPSARHWIILRS